VPLTDTPATDRPARRVPSIGELRALGMGAGLSAVGVTGADPFDDTRRTIVDRRAAGLAGDMQFTYRDPERSTDPGRILPGARSLVVGALGYLRDRPDPDPSAVPRGQVARYSWRDEYTPLRHALDTVAVRLRDEGWRATVVCDQNGLVDKAAAHRAGLGWFGKNTLLMVDGQGSWFVLGSVVTDAPLTGGSTEDPAPPPQGHAAGCGSCTRCLTACPTGALVAPGVLDARRCLAWVVQAEGSIPLELRAAMGDRIYGCDECQQVCPINRRAVRARPPAPAVPGDQATVDLVGLLGSTDEELLAAHGRWYIPGREPRYLRRNALVALGNTGDGADGRTVGALRRALAGRDGMLREHAAWAARRLGRPDLVEVGPVGVAPVGVVA
jgi:epoxyqueuosine reductase